MAGNVNIFQKKDQKICNQHTKNFKLQWSLSFEFTKHAHKLYGLCLHILP